MKTFIYDDSQLSPGEWETSIGPPGGNTRLLTVKGTQDYIGFIPQCNARAICQLKPALRALWESLRASTLADRTASSRRGRLTIKKTLSDMEQTELQILLDAGVVREVKETP